MKIILISGKMCHGKDTFAKEVKSQLVKQGNRVNIIHYGDYLKYCLQTYYHWNGEKDAYGRSLLQHFGTEEVRANDPNFWVDTVARLLKATQNDWDYILIPDVRMPNEIERIYDFFNYNDIITVRVERYNRDETLYESPDFTKEQHSHYSEIALDDYAFQYIIENHHLYVMYDAAKIFIEEIQKKEEVENDKLV